MIREQTLDAIGIASAKTAAVGGGVATVIFGLTAYDVAAIIGAAVAIAGLVMQWRFSRRRDRREEQESLARVTWYRREIERMDYDRQKHQ